MNNLIDLLKDIPEDDFENHIRSVVSMITDPEYKVFAFVLMSESIRLGKIQAIEKIKAGIDNSQFLLLGPRP